MGAETTAEALFVLQHPLQHDRSNKAKCVYWNKEWLATYDYELGRGSTPADAIHSLKEQINQRFE